MKPPFPQPTATDTSRWSDSLIAQTRTTLDCPMTFDDVVCLKNIDGTFGVMTLADVMAQQWTITNRENGTVTSYETSEQLIKAGWAVD